MRHVRTPARERAFQARRGDDEAFARCRDESALAGAIMRQHPDIKRTEALRAAARIVARDRAEAWQ